MTKSNDLNLFLVAANLSDLNENAFSDLELCSESVDVTNI